MVERAGRSVVDRSLGMGEAAGSIPAQSIHFYKIPFRKDFFKICLQCVDPCFFHAFSSLDFLYLDTRGTIQDYHAHP